VFSASDARQQPGLFYVGAIMADGKTPQQGEQALLAEVRKLRDEPVGAAELDKAKTVLIAQDLRQREPVYGRGYAFGYAYYVEGSVAKVNDDLKEIQAVTAADVQRVARKYLPDDTRVTINYVSEKERPAASAAQPTPSQPSAPVAAPPLPEVAEPPQPAEARNPPPPGPPVTPRLPTASERTLANGLRVIVARDGSLPLVTAQLSIRGGGAADPGGKAGLADFTASLLNQGAGSRTAEQVARDIEALGAQINANAGWDSTRIDLQALTAKLPQSMAIFADVVRRPTFAEAELERLRARTLDSLEVALQQPGELARFAAADAVFAGTPYGHVLTGTPASIKRFTRADITAFHQAWYRPDNAVLVLTGDLTPEQGFALAQQAFGDWQKPSAPVPQVQAVAPQAKPRVVVIDLPGTGQAAVDLYLPAIARTDPRYYQVMVASAVLGGGYSARLNEEVRVKRGLSYGANAVLDARHGVGPIAALAQTKNESAVEVAGLMLQLMGGLKTDPPKADELAARKATLTGGFNRSVDSNNGLASYLSGLAVQGVDLNEINRYSPSVEAVSAAQVTAMAGQVLDPSRATLVVAGDAKAFAAQLKAKYPQAEIIPADQLNLDSPTLK
jgi:zinc protease